MIVDFDDKGHLIFSNNNFQNTDEFNLFFLNFFIIFSFEDCFRNEI